MENRITDKTMAGAVSLAGESAPLGDWWELTKPRLSLMSVATAVLGYLAAGPVADMGVFLALCLGTTLAAFSAGVLNQWWEREADARMLRTADRPIAAGRISPAAGLVFGLLLGIGGIGLLTTMTGLWPAALTAATILLYILVYTPLKRVTPLATEIGAIPGALPPLIGWVAAGGGFSMTGWVLFGVLFAWQMPHFMAISRMCRDDYERGGFAVLAVRDGGGRRVAMKSFLWTLALIAVAFLPLREAGIGWLLGAVASLLAIGMLQPAWRFLRRPEEPAAAKRLFFATLLYLPLYLSALVADRFVF